MASHALPSLLRTACWIPKRDRGRVSTAAHLMLVVATLLAVTQQVPAAAGAPSSTGLRAAWFSNAVLAPSAPGASGLNCSGSVPSLDLSYSDAAPIACLGSAQQRPSMDLFSARFDATLTAPTPGSWEFRVVTNGGVRFWIDEYVQP